MSARKQLIYRIPSEAEIEQLLAWSEIGPSLAEDVLPLALRDARVRIRERVERAWLAVGDWRAP